MSMHLLVVSLDGDIADLHTKSGTGYQLPAEWLPAGVREGSAIVVETTGSADGSEVTFRIAEGTTEPEGADVGG